MYFCKAATTVVLKHHTKVASSLYNDTVNSRLKAYQLPGLFNEFSEVNGCVSAVPWGTFFSGLQISQILWLWGAP